jgi:hypothetical protein
MHQWPLTALEAFEPEIERADVRSRRSSTGTLACAKVKTKHDDQAPLQYPVGPFPANPAIGDFNGDGHLDFALATPDGIALLFGNANGTLQSADAYDVGYQVSSVASGDFNGDKIPDLAVGVYGRTPRILLGKGDGTFTINSDKTQSLGPSIYTSTAFAGDFDGDLKIDVLTELGTPGSVSFSVDNISAGAAPLQNGTVTLNETVLVPPGTHSITANWPGDDTFNAHNLSGQTVIANADSSTTISGGWPR